MLTFLRAGGRLSERKARLFAAACCRRIWHLLTDERSRRAVETLERYREGLAGAEELAAAAQAAQEVAEDQESTGNPCAAGAAANAVQADLPSDLRGHEEDEGEELPGDSISDAQDAAFASAWATGYAIGHARHPEESADAWFAATNAEEAVQARLLRDILGDPFRSPPPLAPSVFQWHAGTVVRLARAAYEERESPSGYLDPQRLAVLSDALEEAGADPELVAHLRGPGPHVRGCHILDLLLAKE
jgi:hypothetical protein